MTKFPTSIEEAWNAEGEFRSGATDLWDRSRKKISVAPHIDLNSVQECKDTALHISEDGVVLIPAMMSIAELAEEAKKIGHKALIEAASDLATPAIRNVARVGGNLMQEVRCPYLRSGAIACIQTGSEGCPAREGDHRYLSVVDMGGCIAPHPSTLALVFAALGASVHCIEDGEEKILPIDELWIHPTRRLITAVEISLANQKTYSSWYRISNRRFAEWPLVEVVLYVVEGENAIEDVYAYAGGIASQPFPILSLVQEWKGKRLNEVNIDVQHRFLSNVKRMTQSEYKQELLTYALREALEDLRRES